jgi:hypothetical protein
MVLLSLLTACGGSDSSDGSKFSKSDDTPTDTTDKTGDDTGTDVPVTVPEDNVLVALGVGSGSTFQPGAAQTGLSGNEVLTANGSISVQVDIVDSNANNAQFLGLREVTFESTCSQAGLAEFVPSTIKASGFAKTIYNDLGCGKESGNIDDVVIYVAEEQDNPNATARTSLRIAAAQVGGIDFVSAEPPVISVDGFSAGDSQSYSEMTFKIIDKSGNPMPSRTVKFAFAHNVGGAVLSKESVITQADGTAKVNVRSGVSEGKVSIKAMLESEGESYEVTSQQISIQTKFPEADSLTLSASTFNPNAWEKSGAEVVFTAHLNDHFGSYVLDGTEVTFRATGGSIERTCKTVDGKCTAKWESANPKPVDGYVSVVAYVEGVGDYQDNIKGSGDGFFNFGDDFNSYPEQYVDANGNGQFDADGAYQPTVDIDEDGIPEFLWAADAYKANVRQSDGTYEVESVNFKEEYIDANSNGVFDSDKGDRYQGINCSDNARAIGHCAEKSVTVLKTARIQMSQGNTAYVEGPFGFDSALGRYDTTKRLTCIDASKSIQNIAWRIADSAARRNHLPNGTTVELDMSDVDPVTKSGFGTVGSVYPATAWSLWSSYPANVIDETGKTASEIAAAKAERKYNYLNARGHLVKASIIRGENPKTITGLGAVGVKVKTVNGPEITAGTINVDVYGHKSSLFKSGIPQAKVDVSSGAATFTIKVRNACSQGLPENATLLIGLSNGTLGAVTAAGGAGAVIANDASSASISINDSAQTAIVNLSIAPDSETGEVPNSLTVDYQVPDGSDFRIYRLSDFNIKD